MRVFLAGLLLAAGSYAATIKVTVTNIAPIQGNFLTPVWVGFHNGMFDTYDTGSPVTAGFERLAEDGVNAPLSMEFQASGFGTVDGNLGGGPFGPGATVTRFFTLDAMALSSRYFSYATMIIPSNDAFVSNANPLAFQIFSPTGKFLGANFTVLGTMVRDAGTEVNDELPETTAFLGQKMPDTGTVEGGVVTIHPGFIPGGAILTAFPGADFTQTGYQIAQITVEQVPEPATFALAGLSLGALAFLRRRR